MIVRLHKLSARQPVLADLPAVVTLMRVCNSAASGNVDPTQDDVLNSWQAPGFHLSMDAWVLVTKAGQIVGYADVQRCLAAHSRTQAEFVTCMLVHPDYQARGLGTLLIYLVEERARQLMDAIPPSQSVLLHTTLSSLDLHAHALFVHEEYRLVRNFWRLVLEMAEHQSDPTRVELILDQTDLVGFPPVQRRTGMYSARQYAVYAKELRAARHLEVEPVLTMQGANA